VCENLQFGRVPSNFHCRRCGGQEFPVPPIALPENGQFPSKIVSVDSEKRALLQAIPEGPLRNALAADLQHQEMDIQNMIGEYFRMLIHLFFDTPLDTAFWRCFVDTMTTLFEVDKHDVLTLLDGFAIGFLYSTATPLYQTVPTAFGLSESIAQFVESQNPPRMEKVPVEVQLVIEDDGFVHTAVPLDDGQFICDLPGFLMHSDEMDASNGIPLSCFALTDTDCVVDFEGSSFSLAHQFARSFHFNTFVRMYRVVEEVRVGLFATRLHGPLADEKGRRGTAIPAGSVLFLPFDGELPYPVSRVDWRERKTKSKPQGQQAHVKETKLGPAPKKKPKPIDCPVVLSLLSAFCEDIVPPLPFILLTEKEVQERVKRENPSRMRKPVHRL
jgi:hypothetical protein